MIYLNLLWFTSIHLVPPQFTSIHLNLPWFTLTWGVAFEFKPWVAPSESIGRVTPLILLIGPSTCRVEGRAAWGISLIARDLPLIGISGVPYTVPPKSLTTLIAQQKTFFDLPHWNNFKAFSHPALKGRTGCAFPSPTTMRANFCYEPKVKIIFLRTNNLNWA